MPRAALLADWDNNRPNPIGISFFRTGEASLAHFSNQNPRSTR
jgi:hypothetical protein